MTSREGLNIRKRLSVWLNRVWIKNFSFHYLVWIKGSDILAALVSVFLFWISFVDEELNFAFSFSDSLRAFFFSSSSCLQFSSWARRNILTKFSKVDTTAKHFNENEISIVWNKHQMEQKFNIKIIEQWRTTP